MKSFSYCLLFTSSLLLFVNQVFGYLGEHYSPFTVTLQKQQQDVIRLKKGTTVQIKWQLTPDVQFPLYGYASSRTSKTDIGLLAPDSSRTEPYTYMIDTSVSILDYSYSWSISKDVPVGKYQIGLGFFYHEASPEIYITE